METLFPFGFPAPTAFYLVLYVATLVLHWVFMHYVLAGSAFTLFRRCVPARDDACETVDAILRDWLPLMLSGAITAGIAPLLFVQILYQYEFYTANLLLFHRWMAILPTLIVGFYLLYLLKSCRLGDWPFAVRVAIALGAFGCFFFIAWSWTENHLLSLDRESWSDLYLSQSLVYRHRELIPRLVVWFVLAFPTMAIWVGWQVWYRDEPAADSSASRRMLKRVAVGGLLGTAIAIGVYSSVLSEVRRGAVMTSPFAPYGILAIGAFAFQLLAWLRQPRDAKLSGKWLMVASVSGFLMLLGLAVLREALRLNEIDMSSLYERHLDASRVGGLTIFLGFLGLNSLLIGYCFWLVRTGGRDEQAPPTS